jgi:dGTPase
LGRRHQEPRAAYRSAFQRDRDRIVHSAAFRRLEYKTQVFVNHEGDMFRTRLTHSIEVAQIARTISRGLGLNEDLTEAIALAHDLGHTPFGHAGQDMLNECMRHHGGFEHNLQSLRVVETLEERYPGFPGLNLTYETREGILKHCPPSKAKELGQLGERFLCGRQPSLEAQVANLADEIAYNNHDVDDGLRAGLLAVNDLAQVAIFRRCYDQTCHDWPQLGERRLVHEVVRRMINLLVTDLIENSRRTIESSAPTHIEDVRGAPQPLIGFSATMLTEHRELKRYLHQALYRHYRVCRMSRKAARTVKALFEAFFHDPQLLPPDTQVAAQRLGRSDGESGRARAVSDYIAGMTDRYAIAESERLFGTTRLT